MQALIADIQDELAHSVCKDLSSESASFIHCDVTKETDVENAVSTAISRHGKLDIMFNNAGIVGVVKTDMVEVSMSKFEDVVRVNLVGAFLGTKHAARVMKLARQGSIITTSSVCGVLGGFASHAYTSTKHGVLGLMRNAAVELGQFGIRVNCVSPYTVATEMSRNFLKMTDDEIRSGYSNLKGAIMRPEDVAEAALFLASDDSRYVSGHNLVVDGGFTIVNNGSCMLEGKVALITGGSSGIGESTARLFAKHGAKVVIADIQDEPGHSVCKDLNTESASFVHCDVTQEKDVENAVSTAVSKHGKLDIMFNNAGILETPKPNILDNDKAEFEKVIGVNIVGAFLGTKHAARVMIPARRGSIISTASVCGTIGGVATHAYTSSKHGVIGLMRNTAVELGQHGIRVNCVSPYVVWTPLARNLLKLNDDEEEKRVYSNLKDAVLKAEDIAEAVLFLGSDESKYVSGLNLIVDGGFTIVNPGFCMFPQELNLDS
ncbi:hypothetical protein DKX38_006590 [Salix brachista]|uniref:Uncharacterized protein n=1 Tax=Salix brachista TaxID=2182728 RepID=A0A5N5N4Q4_9ROSI|nr:hypothetical protein DKX38_006590 [Salix brachista]